jgi:hypothetical protein
MDLQPNGDPNRPEFMVTLGLLPPFTRDELEAAYRSRVWTTHPDRGGAVADFLKVQEAYDRALEYVRFHDSRRAWIAAQGEVFVRQQQAADEVLRLKGRPEFEEIDWLRQSLGDGFAMLAERLRGIHLENTEADDAFLSFLAGPPPHAPHLLELNLAGTRITDTGLQALSGFTLLKKLNLSRTRVSGAGIGALLKRLPDLELVEMQGTAAGLWSRWRLQRLLRRRRAESERRKVVLMPG